MSDAPNIAAMDATQAGQHLDTLRRNSEWGARLLKGDAAARAEFDAVCGKVAGVDAPAPPPPAQDAKSKLDRAMADPEFAKKLFARDAATRREFEALTKAAAESDGSDRLAAIVQGHDIPAPAGIETVFNGALSTRDTKTAVQWMKEAGIGDAAIAESILGVDVKTGKPYDAATIAQAKAMKAQRLSDPEWTKRLFAGGYTEKRELTLLSVILSQAA
jgi:hypothetical protein